MAEPDAEKAALESEFDSISAVITDDDGSERVVTVEKLKGVSRQGRVVARDASGYFHVTVDNRNGVYRPLYQERYELVGQFRNGIAYARKNGEWIAIDDEGNQIGLFADIRR